VPVGHAHLGTIRLEEWLRQSRARYAQSTAGNTRRRLGDRRRTHAIGRGASTDT